jgi:AcrR family transcriptional regulator
MTTDTRQRILDVSSELFVEQGYDGTSLREIAERLGISKAALYYHFAGKDQILFALLEPAKEMIGQLHLQLEAAHDVREWADALEWVVNGVFDNRAVFRLIARNRHSAEAILDALIDDMQHEQLHELVEKAAEAASANLGEQVRMIAALGAVTGFDDWAPTLLQDAPPEVLQAELLAATRRILDLPT